MLNLEDSALGDGKAGNLPGVTDDDKIEIHLFISAYPRGYRPAIHIMDVFFREPAILLYLFPERKISFDGFITYEGRRFGVPYSYGQSILSMFKDMLRK